MTFIKLCGMTRQQDAMRAAELGADALGFIFYPQSPRAITLKQAKIILNNLPKIPKKVAVLVNPEKSQVENLLQQLPIDMLQFHGNETENFCNQFQKPYIKAFAATQELNEQLEKFPTAFAWLVDSFDPQKKGGTGQVFNWQLIPKQYAHKIIVAGGLTPENVSEVIKQVAPFGVDVASGIEAHKGIKDHVRMTDFVQAVRNFND